MKMKPFRTPIALAVIAFASSSINSGAAITILSKTTADSGSSETLDVSFDATGASKLVVVVTGEHGFNNTDGLVTFLRYNGVDLSQAVYRLPVTSSTDVLYHGIFYLDNPATGTNTVSLSAKTRGSMSIFALSGTAAGVGATSITPVNNRTIDLNTTTTGSMVFSAFGLGGNGNTGSVVGISADAPLTLENSVQNPNNWQGQVVGTANVTTPGLTTYGFTGGNQSGAVVSAAEFLPIPEPSSLALLGLGGLTLLRRRR